MSIRLLLADDEPLFRLGLRLLLEAEGLEVTGEATTGREALEIAERTRPDVAVLDIMMPEMNGIQTATELRKYSPNTRAILITQYSDHVSMSDAILDHVVGFVPKSQPPGVLVEAIREVAGGSSYLLCGGPDKRKVLTQREHEILRLLAEGKRKRDIAVELKLSPKTVEAHRSNVLRKLHMKDTTDLVRYAIREKLLQP